MDPMTDGARVDHFRVNLTVDGRDTGIWDTKEGGETDSEDSSYKPGGGPRVSLGGSPTTGAVTISRLFMRGRDDDLIPYLRSKAGNGVVIAKIVATDKDGNPYKVLETYRGIFKRVTPPNIDSNSSDPAMLEVEFTPNEDVA